jgi:hypothetical protein
MMQIKPRDAGDDVILAPAIRGTIGAAHEQPVQHREEHGALQRKAVLALARQRRDHRPAAGLLPQPLEHQRRPDPTHRDLDRGLIAGRAQHHGLGRKARTRAHQPFQRAARPRCAAAVRHCCTRASRGSDASGVVVGRDPLASDFINFRTANCNAQEVKVIREALREHIDRRLKIGRCASDLNARFVAANLTPNYPLAFAGYTFPGYTAFYTVILNLAIVVVLTQLFNAMSARSVPLDNTVAADYHA